MTDDLDIIFPKTRTVETEAGPLIVKRPLWKHSKAALQAVGKHRQKFMMAVNSIDAIMGLIEDPEFYEDMKGFIQAFEPEFEDKKRAKGLTFPDDFPLDDVAVYLLAVFEHNADFFRRRFPQVEVKEEETPPPGEGFLSPSVEQALSELNLSEPQLTKSSSTIESPVLSTEDFEPTA
jgi:hypothetical protein